MRRFFSMAYCRRHVVPIALLATLALTGCATTRNVPFVVQSEPLGAYVFYQVNYSAAGTSDWIFLGHTPIDVNRQISTSQLDDAAGFVLQVQKEGYYNQQKSWSGDQLQEEAQDKGRVFWNPRLVPTN